MVAACSAGESGRQELRVERIDDARLGARCDPLLLSELPSLDNIFFTSHRHTSTSRTFCCSVFLSASRRVRTSSSSDLCVASFGCETCVI